MYSKELEGEPPGIVWLAQTSDMQDVEALTHVSVFNFRSNQTFKDACNPAWCVS